MLLLPEAWKPGNITKSNAFAEIGDCCTFLKKLILVFKWLGVSWR